ncbi:MAG: ABC transporter ATP-binding protein [Dehalococcoidia bacterium]|nr:ABC transporter ATP-binding protein [Dehalococcoidia bacterium]
MTGLKLEARNISKEFVKPGSTPLQVLRDVSIQVCPGEFVAIVGASGCGKSTFLRILDGLIEPSAGEVFLDGKQITKPGPDRGFVFQMDSLWPWRSVEGNIRFGLEIQRKPRLEAREIVDRFVRLVGLVGFEKHYPHELSGGMRQRVNVARALATDPEVLLMDEPFANLDAQTREVMQSELLKIWAAHRKTVVFVTHQIDEAVYLADRIFVFSARPGTVKEILEVDIPRPRPLAVKRTPEFLAYVDKIWRLIEKEVIQGLGTAVLTPERLADPIEG